jgi:predicted porin
VKSTTLLGELLMKKHLIAAAVAAAVAAPAMAQNVEVYGIMGLGYSSVKTDWEDVSSKTTTTGAAAQRSGSRIGFRGTEDLGDGLKAGFVYEIAVSNDNATSVFGNTRLAYVDLAGGFGTFRAGKVDSITRQIYNGFSGHGNQVFAPGNVLGGTLGGGTGTGALAPVITSGLNAANEAGPNNAGDGTRIAEVNAVALIASNLGAGGTRVADSIGYISPAFNGFTVQAQLGQSKTNIEQSENLGAAGAVIEDVDTNNRSANFAISYASGPLSVTLGQDRVKSESTGAAAVNTGNKQDLDNEFTTNMLGVSYNFGVARVFGLVTRKKLDLDSTILGVEGTGVGTNTVLDDTVKVKDNTVAVSVPLGAITLVGSYTDGKIVTELLEADIDYKGYQLQAMYAFSKRTTAYAMFGQTKLDDVLVRGEDLKQRGMTIGLQHTF